MLSPVKPLFCLSLAGCALASLGLCLAAEKGEFRPEPGTGRWAVKIAADPDAPAIPVKGVETTVEDLLALPRPQELPPRSTAYPTSRVGEAEKVRWEFEADLTHYRLRPDGDIELTLRGEKRKTLLACMPDPKFLDEKSPWFQQIRLARRTFEARFHPETHAKSSASHVLVTGIGYWSTEAPPEGSAPNGFEIHPVTAIKFLLPPKPAPRPKPGRVRPKVLGR